MFGQKAKLKINIKGCFIRFNLSANNSLTYQLQKYSEDDDSWVNCVYVVKISTNEFWYIPPYEEGINKGDKYRCWIIDENDGYSTNVVTVKQTFLLPRLQMNRNRNDINIFIRNYTNGLKYILEIQKEHSVEWEFLDVCHSATVNFELPEDANKGDSIRCVVMWNDQIRRTVGSFTLDKSYQTLQDVLYTKNDNVTNTTSRIDDSYDITDFDYYDDDEFDFMDGIEFENFCGQLLRANGFTDVRVTKASGDLGADIIATYDGKKYAIQCKRYANKVGFDALKEAHTAKTMYDCDEAAVLTNNYFSNQTKGKAAKLNIHLWDRDVLQNLANNTSQARFNAYKQSVATPSYQATSNNSFSTNVNYRPRRTIRVKSVVSIFGLILLGLIVTIGPLVLLGHLIDLVDTDDSGEVTSKATHKNVAVETQIEESVERIVEITDAMSTTHYVSKNGKEYDINFTYDGDLTTCWQDGEDGDGLGSELTYIFEKCSLSKIEIVNGNRLREGSFYQNNRLARVTIMFFDGDSKVEEISYEFPDEMTNCDVVELDDYITCDRVVIVIEEVYSGTTYSDTGVTEVRLFAID